MSSQRSWPTVIVCVVFIAMPGLCLPAVDASLSAQTGGKLIGTVLDSSRSVMPNVTVVVTAKAGGEVATALSENDGTFVFAALPAGSYALTCRQPGFKRFSRNVRISAARPVLVEIVLSVGESSEKVEVHGSRPGWLGSHDPGAERVMPAMTGERSATVTAVELENLANAGRNAAEFAKILPGMAIATGKIENRPGYIGAVVGINGPIGYFSSNGTQPSAMDMLSEGARISDPGCNCNATINLNTDMVQELKIVTSGSGADAPKGPVVLVANGKSGGGAYHGGVYLHARHFALNATDWMTKFDGKSKPHDTYFFPGFNLGGPVARRGTDAAARKLFFFAGFEAYRQRMDDRTLRTFVPTGLLRMGDFSQAVLDALGPKAGAGWRFQPKGFPDGQVPRSMMDPGALALLKVVPTPNADPLTQDGSNYVDRIRREQNGWQLRGRMDYDTGRGTRVYVSYDRQREVTDEAVNLWWVPAYAVRYPTSARAVNRAQTVVAGLVHTLGQTMTNTVTVTYTELSVPYQFDDPRQVDRSVLGYPYSGVYKNGSRQIPSFTSWGAGVPTVMMPGGFESGANFSSKRIPSIADNMVKMAGPHTIKLGFYAEQTGNKQVSPNYNQGLITYGYENAFSTGNAVADFLLGRVQNYEEASLSPIYDISYRTIEFYAQDAFRIHPRLNLEFGLRLSHIEPWQDRSRRGFVVWDPEAYSNAPGDMASLTGLKWHRLDTRVPNSGAPGRLLFATPRFGIAWDIFGTGKTVLRAGGGAYRYHDSFNIVAGSLDVSNGVRSYRLPAPTTLAGIDGMVIKPVRTGFQALDPGDDQQALTYTYHVTVSRALPGGSLVEIAYVGDSSKHLMLEDPIAYRNLAPVGSLFATADPEAADADLFRPYRNYQQFTIRTHAATQNYNGLQATLTRQHGRFNWNVNYAFSKTLGMRGGTQGTVGDPYHLENNYGPLAYDRTHIFNATYSVYLGQPFRGHNILNSVTGGWQVSGITQIQSGPNLQAFSAAGPAFALTGTLKDGTALTRRTILGTPDLSLQPHIVCDPRSGLRENQFVNPACFAPPTPGNNGDFVFPYLRGPAFFNSDLSLFKNFLERDRRRLQVRISAFNFLNHPLLTFLEGDYNLVLEYRNGIMVRPDFGVATHKMGSRVLQAAIKFDF